MTGEPTGPTEHETESARPASRWRRGGLARRLLLPLGIAAGVAVGVVSFAVASGDSSSPSSSSSTQNDDDASDDHANDGDHANRDRDGHSWWGDRGGPHKWGGGWGGMDLGVLSDVTDVVRGEVIVETEGGDTETLFVQKGELTEATETSITIESSDGHTETYAVTDDTALHVDDAEEADELSAGVSVLVSATESDGTLTASLVVDCEYDD